MAKISSSIDAWNPKSEKGKINLNTYIAKVRDWSAKDEKALADGDAPQPVPVFNGPGSNPQSPTALYNGMIHPIQDYAIRGAIWYQGESNGGEGISYFDKMKALIQGWRQVWQQGDFSFYFVQLANFR